MVFNGNWVYQLLLPSTLEAQAKSGDTNTTEKESQYLQKEFGKQVQRTAEVQGLSFEDYSTYVFGTHHLNANRTLESQSKLLTYDPQDHRNQPIKDYVLALPQLHCCIRREYTE
ncbi:hypothetical protein MMC18_005517 [Xylographa bjoerkii]|nr:hypothetical protein [Xylographa bjoerkii]